MSIPRQLRVCSLCTRLQHTLRRYDQRNNEHREGILPAPGTHHHATVIACVTPTARDGCATPRRPGTSHPAGRSPSPPAQKQRYAVRFLLAQSINIQHRRQPQTERRRVAQQPKLRDSPCAAHDQNPIFRLSGRSIAVAMAATLCRRHHPRVTLHAPADDWRILNESPPSCRSSTRTMSFCPSVCLPI
jgi:hypothetical protein